MCVLELGKKPRLRLADQGDRAIMEKIVKRCKKKNGIFLIVSKSTTFEQDLP